MFSGCVRTGRSKVKKTIQSFRIRDVTVPPDGRGKVASKSERTWQEGPLKLIESRMKEGKGFSGKLESSTVCESDRRGSQKRRASTREKESSAWG
jgi:hypothetical protein